MSKVAIVRTTPQTVLQDVEKAMQLAHVRDAPDNSTTTILKNNLSRNLFKKVILVYISDSESRRDL